MYSQDMRVFSISACQDHPTSRPAACTKFTFFGIEAKRQKQISLFTARAKATSRYILIRTAISESLKKV